VQRRRALRNIGLGISAGFGLPVLPGLLSSCGDKDPGPEIDYSGIVAIIGAGASGLYAGDILKSKGVTIKVFEAADRVGGRVRSLRLLDGSPLKTDFPIELGAGKIIGTDSLWAEIISQLNIPTVDIASPVTDSFIIGSILKERSAIEGDADFTSAKNFLQNLKTYSGANVSVLQAIQFAGINERVHSILNSWIGNKYGTSNSRLGIKAVAEGLTILSTNRDERLLRSNPMQDAMASRFSKVIPQVELNSVVKTIDYSSAKIKISGKKNLSGGGTEDFTMEVDKVIIAVPVSILKSGDISFVPSLPATTTTALSRMGMDASIRVVMDFKQNFWGNTMGYLYGGVQGPDYFNAGVLRSDFTKTLNVTINGPKAEQFTALTPEAVVLSILAELDSVFDGKASANIRKDDDKMVYEFKDWTKEPYIRGGVSYVKPGGTNDDRIALAKPISNQVFFAGEACDATGESGTISGALLAAERATKEVIDSILNP
jgi:monoamine oxidase